MSGSLPIEALSKLRQRKSTKWREYDGDVLPLPVAEMDYPIAEPIIEAVTDMMRRSDTGYLGKFPELGEAFAGFALRRWNWQVNPDSIRIATDVGVATIEILRALGSAEKRVRANSSAFKIPEVSLAVSLGVIIASLAVTTLISLTKSQPSKKAKE